MSTGSRLSTRAMVSAPPPPSPGSPQSQSGAERSAGGGGAASSDRNAQVGGRPSRRAGAGAAPPGRAAPGRGRPGGVTGAVSLWHRGGPGPPPPRRGEGSLRFTSGPRRRQWPPRGEDAARQKPSTAASWHRSPRSETAPPPPKGQVPRGQPGLPPVPRQPSPRLGPHAHHSLLRHPPPRSRLVEGEAGTGPNLTMVGFPHRENPTRGARTPGPQPTAPCPGTRPLPCAERGDPSRGHTHTFPALLAWGTPEPPAFPPPAFASGQSPQQEPSCYGVTQGQAGQVNTASVLSYICFLTNIVIV